MRTLAAVLSGALLGLIAGALVAVICPFIALGCIPAGVVRALREVRKPAVSLRDQLAEALRDIEENP